MDRKSADGTSLGDRLYAEWLMSLCRLSENNTKLLNESMNRQYILQPHNNNRYSNYDADKMYRHRCKWICSDIPTKCVHDDEYDDDDDYTDPRFKYCYLCSTGRASLSSDVTSQRVKKLKTTKRRVWYDYSALPLNSSYKSKDKTHVTISREALYKIVIKTGSQSDAGTDANVYIRITGSQNHLPKTRLFKHHASVVFRFGKNTSEAFFLRSSSLGDIKHVIIEHDGLVLRQGWYLEQIAITDMASQQTWICECRKWLSLHQDPFKICTDLKAKPLEPTCIDYTITVVTGDQMMAGTDAHVFITLFGRIGQTKKVHLKDTGKGCFEKGGRDTFQVSLRDVGKLERLRIEHDGSGSAAGWFLVKVIVSARGKDIAFPLHDWIAKHEGDGKLFKILYPTRQAQSYSSEDDTSYEVEVQTGDVKFAGTDANVYVIIRGSCGNTGKVSLTNDKDKFKRRQKDSFAVTGANVGEVKSLIIGHDNTGVGPGWFLSMVTLRRNFTKRDVTAMMKKERRKAKERIDEERSNLKENADEKADDRVGRDTVFQQLEREILLEYEEGKQLVKRLTRKTKRDFDEYSDNRDAGNKRRLRRFNGHDDEVEVAGDDDRLNLRRGGDDIRDFVRRPLFELYTFACDRWLAKDEDDGKLQRELLPTSKKVYYE